MLQRLQKEEIDPLQRELEQVNKLGQGLVQSAALGVATGVIEEELETLNDQWGRLNEKVHRIILLFWAIRNELKATILYWFSQ